MPLTTSIKDAQRVIDGGTCAAVMQKELPSELTASPRDQVRIAFDGDAVLFDESSELVYKVKGLEEFQTTEDSQQDIPMQEGPYATLLKNYPSYKSDRPLALNFRQFASQSLLREALQPRCV